MIFTIQTQLLYSNGFRWHSMANLSVCAIDFTDKTSTTGLPEILVCQSSLDPHSQCPMCAMCVSACSRGI